MRNPLSLRYLWTYLFEHKRHYQTLLILPLHARQDPLDNLAIFTRQVGNTHFFLGSGNGAGGVVFDSDS